MKKELHLGVLFSGKLDPSFDRILNTIKTKLGDLETVTKKVTEAQKKQGAGILELGKGLKSYIKDVEKLILIQARWYGAKALLFAAVEAPVAMLREGLALAGELDKARAMMDRYDAMENKMSATTKLYTEDIINYARQLAITLPITFEEIIKSADRLRAAGVSIDVIRASLKDFAQLQVAFPEIEAEKFTTAVIGFLNTYRNMPGLKEMGNDGIRLRAILDKLVMGLAKGVIAAGDLGKVIQHMGQASQSAGFSLDMMIATAVMLTNLGSKAPAAARAFRGLLNSLTKPETAGELKKIGIELNKNLTLAEQFPKIIEGLRRAVGTGEAGFKLGAFSFLGELTSTERVGALTAIIKEWEKLTELQTEIASSEGALSRAADRMAEHLGNLWIVFKNISKEFGKMFLDEKVLANLLENINNIFRRLLDLPKIIKEFASEIKGLLASLVSLYVLKHITGLFTQLSWVIKNLGFIIKYFAFATLPSLLTPLNLISAAIGIFVWHMSALGEKAKQTALDVNAFRASLLGLNEETLKAKEQFLELQLLEGTSTITGKKVESLVNLGNIREQLKIVREMLKEVQKSKIEPSPEEIPGEGVPEKTKAYARSRIASAKAEANALLAIWRNYQSVYMSWLDGFYKLGLIGEEAYYEKKVENINETTSKELDALEDAWKKEQELFALEKVEHAGDAEKLLEIKEREYTERLRLMVKFHEVYNAKEKGENDLLFERESTRQERLIKLYDYTYSRLVKIAELAMEKIRFALEERGKETEFAYEQGLIGVRKYYRDQYKIISEYEDTEKDRLKEDLERYKIKYAEKWLLAGEDLKKKEDLDREMEDKEVEHQTNMLKAEQRGVSDRSNLRRKEVVDLEVIYSDSGYLGVLKELFRNIEVDWKKFGTRGYQLFKEIAESFTSAFEDFFFDVLEWNLKSAEDYFKSFLSSINRAIAKFLADEMTAEFAKIGKKMAGSGGLLSSIFGFFGLGGGGGGGGSSLAALASAASGWTGFAEGAIIRRPTLLVSPKSGQVEGVAGEAGAEVLGPADKMRDIFGGGGGGANIFYINAVDATSFVELCQRNPSGIISVVGKNVDKGGILRNTIKKRCK